MLWVFYGIAYSLCRAAFVETGRLYPVDGWKAGFLQSLFALVFLLPFWPLIDWPATRDFYLAAAGVSLVFTLGTLMQLTLSRQKNGRIFSIAAPLEALIAFALWMTVMPYTADLQGSLALLAAFILCAAGVLFLRPNDVSGRIAGFVVTIAAGYAVAAVVTKIALPVSQVLAFTLINFAVMAVVMGAVALVKKKLDRELLSAPLLKVGMLTGLFAAAGFQAFAMGVVLAPNPAYISLLVILLPVWLILWHGVLRQEDRASRPAGLMIALGILILIVLAP